MTTLELILVLATIALSNVDAMSIKRSDTSLEKVDESAFRVNYDVYPVRYGSAERHSAVSSTQTIILWCLRSFLICVKFVNIMCVIVWLGKSWKN